jgi:ABC-type sugar transport system ATPase subunit
MKCWRFLGYWCRKVNHDKILSGAIQPTSGEIFCLGKKVVLSGTRDAKALGIETVFQHLALVDCLSIEKNIYLGKEITKKSAVSSSSE